MGMVTTSQTLIIDSKKKGLGFPEAGRGAAQTGSDRNYGPVNLSACRVLLRYL